MTLRILLADDHRIMRHGLKSALEQDKEFVVVGEAENGRDAVAMAKKLAPDVILMDVAMPGLNGMEAARQVAEEVPAARVIALSMHTHKRYVMGMFEAGASGFLLKTCAFDELVKAVRTVALGKTYISADIAGVVVTAAVNGAGDAATSDLNALTPRQREVLQLIAEGRTTRQIAKSLHVSERTVETHRRQIMDKLDLRSIAELTKFAIQEGLTSL